MNGKADNIYYSDAMELEVYSLPTTPELLFKVNFKENSQDGSVIGNESMVIEDVDLGVIRTNTDISFDLTSGSRDQLMSRDSARESTQPRVPHVIPVDSPAPGRHHRAGLHAKKPAAPANPPPCYSLHPDLVVPATQQLPTSISRFGWYLVLATFVATGVVGYLIFRLQGDTVSIVLSVVVGMTVVMVGFVYFLVYCVVPRRRHKQFATYS